MRVFVIGGTGGVGVHLTRLLSTQHQQVSVLVRDRDKVRRLDVDGVRLVEGDLVELDCQSLASMLVDHDVVVFTAGAGGGGGQDMTKAVDGDGLKLAVDAAVAAGIKRFILVSAFPEAGRGRTISPTFEYYMSVKKDADVYLAATNLDWVIVRPGVLSDHPGSEKISIGQAIAYGSISREDVAATLAELVATPAIGRAILELTNGESPVREAVHTLANKLF